jgi:hypothetical protein
MKRMSSNLMCLMAVDQEVLGRNISIATNTGWVLNTHFYVSHTTILVSNIANPLNTTPHIRVTTYLFCIRVTFFLPIQLSYLALYFMHVSFLIGSLWILWRLTLNPPASIYNLIELPTNVMSMTITPRTVSFRTTPNYQRPPAIVYHPSNQSQTTIH